jgi:acyl carrier protein
MNEFISELTEILEVDELSPNSNLQDLPEFDSLSMLSIIAMIDSNFGVNLSADKVRNAGTPERLYALVQEMKH